MTSARNDATTDSQHRDAHIRFARELLAKQTPGALFPHAERRDDGIRTFRLIEGEPLSKSLGQDLYREVFAESSSPADARS